MARLNQERQNRLEPKRMETALKAIKEKGYKTTSNENAISFTYNDHKVIFYPYSGWHTGKTIKDGRGLKSLLKQI